MSKTEHGAPPAPKPATIRVEKHLTGIAVSPGVAVGKLFAATEPEVAVPVASATPCQPEAELARLDNAVAKSRKQLAKLRARLGVLPEDTQHEIAPLIDAYTQMLSGSRLLRQARKRITEHRVSAELAVHDEAEALAAIMLSLPGDDP